MRFDELNDNINTVLMTILDSQNLCKLLYYNTNNPFSEPDIQDTSEILFTSLFPTPIVPQITDEAKSFITIILDEFALARTNTEFKTSKIIFNVFCHINIWILSGTGKLRPYLILNEIDKLFNQQRLITIGRLEFQSSRWIAVNEKFQGYRSEYRVVDFN